MEPVPLHLQILSAYERHFVLIGIDWIGRRASGRPPVLFSGFLLSINDTWLVVTAGHCVNEIINAAATTRVQIRLLFKFQKSVIASPLRDEFILDYETARPTSFFAGGSGTDVGVLYVDGLTRVALQKIGKEPFVSQDSFFTPFASDTELVHEVMGLPQRLTSFEQKDSNGGQFGLALQLLRFDLLDGLSNEYEDYGGYDPSGRTMYGKLKSAGVELPDVMGMSGGPLICWKADGHGVRYWLTGLQAAYWPQHKIILGPRIEVLDELIRGELK